MNDVTKFSYKSSGTWSISISLYKIMVYYHVLLTNSISFLRHCSMHLNFIHCVIGLCYRYERFEVLAVFTTTVLVMFGALFIVKER